MPSGPARVQVYFEPGRSRVFACAVEWPGWCRRAKTEEAALEELRAYAPRYAVACARAGVEFPPSGSEVEFDVVQRLSVPPGKAFSPADFGSLGLPCDLDVRPLTPAEAGRLAALVEASWAVLDDVAAAAPPQLRKGPRGGGRDRDAIVEHVVGAEAAYARKVGVRHPTPKPGDRAAVEALRADVADGLRAARRGEPRVEKGWLPRYAARRIAWHVLDHAWEIEDRSEADSDHR